MRDPATNVRNISRITWEQGLAGCPTPKPGRAWPHSSSDSNVEELNLEFGSQESGKKSHHGFLASKLSNFLFVDFDIWFGGERLMERGKFLV